MCFSTMRKDSPIESSGLQWPSSASLATCVEFFDSEVVFSLCEDDVSLLRRKSQPHWEQKFAVSSNFSSPLNAHSGFGHLIVCFLQILGLYLFNYHLKGESPILRLSNYAYLGFLERRKLLPGKEPPRSGENIDRACAKKEECKGYLTNRHKGYLAAHCYCNRVGK